MKTDSLLFFILSSNLGNLLNNFFTIQFAGGKIPESTINPKVKNIQAIGTGVGKIIKPISNSITPINILTIAVNIIILSRKKS